MSHIIDSQSGFLSPDDSVHTAGERMRTEHKESLPVTEERKFVGMVEDPLADVQVSRFGHSPYKTLVSETMNREATYCFEDDDCDTVLKRMSEQNLEQLPVVDRDMKILGMVTSVQIKAALERTSVQD